MGRFNKQGGGGGQFFGRDGFGRKNFSREGRSPDRGSRQMFKTVCSNCGRDCEVPFQPTNSKPVYCDDCFAKMRGERNGGQSDRPRFGDRGRYQDRKPAGFGGQDQNKGQFENLNIKLDKILRLLDPKAVSEISAKPDEVVTENKVEAKKEPKKTKVVEEKSQAEVKTESLEKPVKAKKTSKKTA